MAPIQPLLQTLQRVPFHCWLQSQPPGMVQVPRPAKQPAAQMAIVKYGLKIKTYQRETLRTSRAGGASPTLIASTPVHKHQ